MTTKLYFKTVDGRYISLDNNVKDMEKARVTKYVKRVPKPSGKGYYYFYTKQQFQDYKDKGIVPKEEGKSSVWDKLKSFFGGNAEEPVSKLHDTVTKQGISITKDSLAEHLAEYIANKAKWDARFSGEKKEKGEAKPKSEQPKSEKKEGSKTVQKWNFGVMRTIAGIYGSGDNKEKSGLDKFKEAAKESVDNMKNAKSQKIVNFKGDDTDYHVVDDWTQDGIRLYRVVIDEKIDQFDKTKDTEKREDLSEVIPASEFEDKKSPDNFDTMPEGESFDAKEQKLRRKIKNQMEKEGISPNSGEWTKTFKERMDKEREKQSQKPSATEALKEELGKKKSEGKGDEDVEKIVKDWKNVFGNKFNDFELLALNKLKDSDTIGLPSNMKTIKEKMPTLYPLLHKDTLKNTGMMVRTPEITKLIDQYKKGKPEPKKESQKEGSAQGNGESNLYSPNAKKLSHGQIKMANIKDPKEKKIFEQLKPANMITDGGRDYKPLYSYSLEGQDQGVWTDSRMLIIDKKVSDEIYETNKQREFLREKKKNPDKTDEQIIESIKRKGEGSFPNWKQIIPKTESLSDKEAKFTGQYHKPEDKNAPDVVEYSDDNVKVHFMADYIATIKNKFPDAKMYLTGTMSPAVFKVGNEIKAVVMPIQQKAGREMKTLEKALLNLREELMFKAQTTKYIKKIPNPKGKGYIYFYTPEQVKAYQKDGTIPNQQKKPEVKTETGGKTNIEKLKEVTKKVATIFADALSAKDAVQPTGAAVEQTGENIGEKAKEKKRLEEKSVSDKKKPEKKPEDKPKK